PHTSNTSTLNRKKSTRSNNTLKIQTNWKRELSTGRDGRYRLGENTGFPGFLRQPERNRHPLMQSQGHAAGRSVAAEAQTRREMRLRLQSRTILFESGDPGPPPQAIAGPTLHERYTLRHSLKGFER
ncbi:hypothetical protein, partial [Ensifer canadensis]|uniref:hypothetical protein n=1 Tax=Ensifer canadensis TaxID=555315 RepID=UPI00193F6723